MKSSSELPPYIFVFQPKAFLFRLVTGHGKKNPERCSTEEETYPSLSSPRHTLTHKAKYYLLT